MMKVEIEVPEENTGDIVGDIASRRGRIEGMEIIEGTGIQKIRAMVPLAEKATGLKFDMVHIETKGKYGRAGSELFAWCQLRDKAAGITDWEDPKSIFKKAKDAIYKAYHRQGERWASGEAAFLKTGLDAIGATAEEFEAARKTPEVQQLADSWKPSYDVAKIQGIPAYVVNGKYLIMTKSIRSVQGLVDLITELSKK